MADIVCNRWETQLSERESKHAGEDRGGMRL